MQLWHEYQYRKLYHLTHEEYENEPEDLVSWTLGFLSLEAQMQNDAMKRQP